MLGTSAPPSDRPSKQQPSSTSRALSGGLVDEAGVGWTAGRPRSITLRAALFVSLLQEALPQGHGSSVKTNISFIQVRMYTAICALYTCAVIFFSLLHVYMFFCHAFIAYLSMCYFCVGSRVAKLVMRPGLRISIPLQAVAAAIWIIKKFFEII